MKKILLTMTAAVALSAAAQVPFKVIAPVPDVDDGAVAMLINYDNGDTVAVAQVADHKALFTGDIDDPVIARVYVNGKRYGTTVVEQGTSAINQQTHFGVGTMLNDILKACVDTLNAVEDKAANVQSEDEMMALLQEYLGKERAMVEENIDNPIGVFLFHDMANYMEPAEVIAFVDANPDLRESQRVQALLESINRKMSTMPGNMFTDFEVTYNGVTKRLSDYVGKGQYVLVDFWASWCGPCMREIETLRKIYEKYPEDKLKILGVAVWDEPADTEAAIKRKNIPWECIINAQHIPTDLYGIEGIPCIILFGPDGTILSRDLQGVQLSNFVDSALN